MTSRVRMLLWVLSGLAVLWTVSALAMMSWMGSPGGCPMCSMGMRGAMGAGGASQGRAAPGGDPMGGGMMDGGMMDGAMMSGGMTWMMLTMGLTWLVMLTLDAVFIYLVATAVRARRRSGAAPGG